MHTNTHTFSTPVDWHCTFTTISYLNTHDEPIHKECVIRECFIKDLEQRKTNSLLRQNWQTSHTWRTIPNSNSHPNASKRPTNYISAILLLSLICDTWCSSHRGAAEKPSIPDCDSVTGLVAHNTANNHSAFILKANSPRRIMGCDATSVHR